MILKFLDFFSQNLSGSKSLIFKRHGSKLFAKLLPHDREIFSRETLKRSTSISHHFSANNEAKLKTY